MKNISMTCDDIPNGKAERLILEVLASGQLSPGPKVREFEKRLAERHGAKHAIFVNSGTDALRLSLLALKEKYGWPDGTLVAVPALTFVATVNVILQAALKPLFVDVGMNDYTMNPWNLAHQVDCAPDHLKDLKLVMPVQLFGQECDPYLYELCRKNKWKILEDSCETILNPLFGDVGCHSTYMAHHLMTGVGGFALTNDEELNRLIRSYANHGRDTAYLPGYHSMPLSKELLKLRFQFHRQGYSSRATEFEAALGLSQLDDLEHIILQRKQVAHVLCDLLKDYDDLHLPACNSNKDHTFMMFPIVLKEDSKINKYDLCLHLEEHGIETRDMMPIINQPCFKNFFPEDCWGFSVAKWINEKGFYIPCHQGISARDIAHILTTFDSFLTDALDRMAV